jgi:hypothetical protein
MFNPLLDISESYILEECPNISLKKLAELRQTTTHYLSEIITFHRAAGIFFDKIQTTRPVERIYAIISVPDSPIQLRSPMAYPRSKSRSWTEYEDQRLLCGVHKFGLENWTLIAGFVGTGRTRSQCSQRWSRGLDPRISKTGWSREEEQRLMELVQLHGPHSWKRISSEIRTRSDSQCRYHYFQITKNKNRAGASASLSPANSVFDLDITHLLSAPPSAGMLGPPKGGFPCIAELLRRLESA